MCVSAVHAAEVRPGALDRIIETTRKMWEVPGVAVAIVHGDETVYIKGFGVKRHGAIDPVTPDTRFAICSASKAFTTAAMGLLVDEGKVRWDDPVRKHLPYFKLADPLADANVTLRDLASHRTGLASHDLLWDNSPWSRDEIARRIGLLPQSRPFRSEFLYSNIMFVVLGEVVGRIAGTTWEEFVTRRLLAPLGMKNSDFGAKDPTKSPEVATPHAHVNQKVEPVDWYKLDTVGPAGAINSSVRDLTRWMRLHLNEGTFEGKVLLKETTIHETHTPQMLIRNPRTPVNADTNLQAYGMGWYIYDYRGHLVIDHPGLIEGFSFTVLLLPVERYGVAILSNLGDQMPPMPAVLKRAIMDELLGLPPIERGVAALEIRRQAEDRLKKQLEQREVNRRKDTRPSLDTKEYVGVYEDPAYGIAQVREDAGRLTIDWNHWHMPLEHHHFDAFRVTGERRFANMLVQFRLYPNGSIESVRFAGRDFFRQR